MDNLTRSTVAAIALVLLTACGSSYNTSPTPAYPFVSGTWSGTMQSDNSGTNNVALVLTSNNSLVVGTWTSTAGWSGSVTGGLGTQGNFSGALTFTATNADGSACTGSGTFGGAFTSSRFSAASNGFVGSCATLPTNVTLLTQKQ